jgi:cysteine dioxygenase
MGGRKVLLALFAHWDRNGGVISRNALRRRFDRLRLDRTEVADCTLFSDLSYQRILIHSGPCYDALILCWRSGQASPIHDHGGSTCGVYIIEGTATETVFEVSPCGRLAPVRSRKLGAGAFRVSGDRDIHQMANLESPGCDLISLHVYSPPLTATRTYSISETSLAEHVRPIGTTPRLLTATIQPDGLHPFPSTSLNL